MFYKTRMRYHIRRLDILRDTRELRSLGDQFSYMARAIDLRPIEAAALFVLNTLRNAGYSDTDVTVQGPLKLYCLQNGVDFESILALDDVSRPVE